MVDRSSGSGLIPSGFTSQFQCSPALRLLGKLLNPWEPWWPHLWNGDHDRICLTALLLELERALSTGPVQLLLPLPVHPCALWGGVWSTPPGIRRSGCNHGFIVYLLCSLGKLLKISGLLFPHYNMRVPYLPQNCWNTKCDREKRALWTVKHC